MYGMGSGAAGKDRGCTLSGEIRHLGSVRAANSSLAGPGAADSHIRRVNMGQWKRKCLEKPESIACSLLSLVLTVFPALGKRWKVLAAATDTA